jgi:hypothetical protein
MLYHQYKFLEQKKFLMKIKNNIQYILFKLLLNSKITILKEDIHSFILFII